MPYNDQQIEYLKSLDPSVAQGLIGKMTDAQRTDFSNSMTAYSNRKAQAAQPFTGASDVGTAHATPPAQTEEQSMIAARTGGGGFGQFPAGTEAESLQAARNRAFLPYAWNTPQHVVNSWVDKVIPPTPKMQAQDADWWAQRNAAEAQSSAPGVASMINPLSLAGGRGLKPSTLAGRLGAGAAGGGLYRATQPNASIYNIAGSAALGLGAAGAGEMISNEISNYLNRGAQTQNGAYISPSVGYNPQTSATPRALKQVYGTTNILLPPEIQKGESVADVIEAANGDMDLRGAVPGNNRLGINDIQRQTQGTLNVGKAQDVNQRLTAAAAAEHGVDLSLGDISGDPALRAKEMALEAKSGSGMNEFRARQGAQVRQAIINLGNKQDNNSKNTPYGFLKTPDYDQTTEAAPPRSLSAQVEADKIARESGQIGQNPTEAERLYNNIGALYANYSNPRAIQLSLQGQHWQNRQISSENYEGIKDAIADRLNANPQLPKTVNVDPVKKDIADLISENETSPAYDKDLAAKLETWQTNLSREGVDLSYPSVKKSITQMEGTIADLGQAGNRN